MYKLINLIFLDFKLLSKSKTFYLKLILFPAVLILILGTVLGGSSTKVPAFKVAYYSEDSSVTDGNKSMELGASLKDKVLKSEDVKTMITLKEVESYKEGKALADSGKVSVFIYVPKGFTLAFLRNSPISIDIIGSKNNPIDKSIVKNLLDIFVQNTKTVFIEDAEVTL